MFTAAPAVNARSAAMQEGLTAPGSISLVGRTGTLLAFGVGRRGAFHD
jgi:hypothetical protein